MAQRPKDTSWIRQSFLLKDTAIQEQDMVRRVLSTAVYKFTDTTLGGNFAINAPPQYTRFADIKAGGNSDIVYQRGEGNFVARKRGNFPTNLSLSRGMGRYYSEQMDDNGQYVVMRFGVPEYNSLANFFGSFYDPTASSLARTGRSAGLIYSTGKAAGYLLALPFAPLIATGRAIRFFSEKPTSKYYYMKPTMALYWNAVNAIVNGIAVNIGIVPRVLTAEQTKIYSNPEFYGKETASDYHKLLPEVIGENGSIDVYAIATRAQRLNASTNTSLRARISGSLSESGATTAAQAHLKEMAALSGKTGRFTPPTTFKAGKDGPSNAGGLPPPAMDKYLAAYAELATSAPPTSDGDVEKADDRKQYDLEGYGSKFAEFFEGERRDGAAFVTFRVDNSGSASESFSNSSKESEIASKINSMSSAGRSSQFNFAGGNIGDGAVASAVEGALGMVKDFAGGIADGVGLSGLATLAGSAFVDIPKTWDSSTANLPRADYTIELRSPYGNKLSRLQNLYIPLSMLLAGALPLSTGMHSYTSPFLCELYCRGRTAIRLGMIDSLSITRGVGNMGWTQDGEPLGIDVSFSVVDMSSIMHMPILPTFTATKGAVLLAAEAAGTAAGATIGGDGASADAGAQYAKIGASALMGSNYDDDNSYTDYLAVLGSLSFQDMVYVSRKWRLNLTKNLNAFDSWRSPGHLASWVNGTFPGRVINALSQNTDRP